MITVVEAMDSPNHPNLFNFQLATFNLELCESLFYLSTVQESTGKQEHKLSDTCNRTEDRSDDNQNPLILLKDRA